MGGGERAMNVDRLTLSSLRRIRNTDISSNMSAQSADIRARLSSAIPMASRIECIRTNGASLSLAALVGSVRYADARTMLQRHIIKFLISSHAGWDSLTTTYGLLTMVSPYVPNIIASGTKSRCSWKRHMRKSDTKALKGRRINEQ